MRIQVKSRSGNVVIGVLGVLYFVAGVVLLVIEAAQTWGAAGLMDYAVAIVLLACIATGAFFVSQAARNLGLRLRPRAALHHREDAVAVR